LQRLRDFLGEFARANRDDPRAQLEAGKAYRRLASIQGILGQQAEAEKNVQRAISALQSLPDSGSGRVQFELAMSWNEYGGLLRGGPREAEAEQYLRQTLAMLTAMPPSEDFEFLWALGVSYSRHGSTLAHLRRLPEAEDTLKKARDVFQQLAARFPKDPFSRYRAAATLHDLANVKWNGKDPKAAEAYYQRARDEMEQGLKAKPHVTQFQDLLSLIEHNLGNLLDLTQRRPQAEERFRRAIALRLKLATNYPTVPAYRRGLIHSLQLLDECLQQSGRPAEGLALFENLARDYPTVPEYQLALAHALTNRGAFLGLEKQWQKAEEFLRRALSLEEKLNAPRSPDDLEWQCRTLQSLAVVAQGKGRAHEAEKFSRANLALRKEWFTRVKADPGQQPHPLLATFYAKQEVHYDVGRPAEKLARSYGLLTELLRPAHRWQEISGLYEEALKVVGDAAGVNDGMAWFLATCTVAKFHDPARAVRLAEKALMVAAKDPLLAANEGDIRNTLGVAHYRAGNWQAAVEALEQSRKLRRGGDAVDWLFLAMAHQKLGRPDDARKCYAQAVQWLEDNRQALAADPTQAALAEELGRFRREAEETLGQKKK